jgi:hypothetical protein
MLIPKPDEHDLTVRPRFHTPNIMAAACLHYELTSVVLSVADVFGISAFYEGRI